MFGWEIPKSEAKTPDISNLAFLACIKAQSDRGERPELSSPKKGQIRPLLANNGVPLRFWVFVPPGHPHQRRNFQFSRSAPRRGAPRRAALRLPVVRRAARGEGSKESFQDLSSLRGALSYSKRKLRKSKARESALPTILNRASKRIKIKLLEFLILIIY